MALVCILILGAADPFPMLRLTLKTLQQQTFNVEAGSSDKVFFVMQIKDIKFKVQESQGFQADHQKLIFKGIST